MCIRDRVWQDRKARIISLDTLELPPAMGRLRTPSHRDFTSGETPVSYTHLDVYKRQVCYLISFGLSDFLVPMFMGRFFPAVSTDWQEMCIRDSSRSFSNWTFNFLSPGRGASLSTNLPVRS